MYLPTGVSIVLGPGPSFDDLHFSCCEPFLPQAAQEGSF